VAISFGADCIDDLILHLGSAQVIVMAFERAVTLGWRQRLSSQLGERLHAWLLVPDGLPTMACARALSEQVWPLTVDASNAVLLAVGGSTTLDLAKVVRCRPLDSSFDAVAAALRGRAPWPALQPMTLWIVPTTAGTGNEVTRWATVWDVDSDVAVRRSLDEPFGYPQRAYIDPTLTLSCPATVTRDGALDALSHALEAIWNRHANPISDSLALSAARRIVGALPEALAAPQRLASREALTLAAVEAGRAFSQTRTALAHALTCTLTLQQGTPQGRACALWLPAAWRLALRWRCTAASSTCRCGLPAASSRSTTPFRACSKAGTRAAGQLPSPPAAMRSASRWKIGKRSKSKNASGTRPRPPTAWPPHAPTTPSQTSRR
jgi:alcohol dehydrogenase class IV